MRYGPCGKIVDWGRNAYKTTCRFWEDSEETSTIRWVEALPDAPTIGQWSAIGMSIWDRFPPPEGVGEVDGAYKQFTGQTAPAGLDGNHVCATPHEIEYGGKYLPDDPPAEYDDLGYLKCCEVPPPPPPVTPVDMGANCQQAPGCVTGVDYEGRVYLPGPSEWWARIPVPVGTPCRFTWSPITPGTYEVYLFGGANCDGAFWLVPNATPDDCHTFTAPFNPPTWIRVKRTGPTPLAYSIRFRIDVGACP